MKDYPLKYFFLLMLGLFLWGGTQPCEAFLGKHIKKIGSKIYNKGAYHYHRQLYKYHYNRTTTHFNAYQACGGGALSNDDKARCQETHLNKLCAHSKIAEYYHTKAQKYRDPASVAGEKSKEEIDQSKVPYKEISTAWKADRDAFDHTKWAPPADKGGKIVSEKPSKPYFEKPDFSRVMRRYRQKPKTQEAPF